MTRTTIYLSVICGNDSLTLDGNLYLFRELLTTLSNTVEELPQACVARVETLSAQNTAQKMKQEGMNVTE